MSKISPMLLTIQSKRLRFKRELEVGGVGHAATESTMTSSWKGICALSSHHVRSLSTNPDSGLWKLKSKLTHGDNNVGHLSELA
jgi:hypothetical protein